MTGQTHSGKRSALWKLRFAWVAVGICHPVFGSDPPCFLDKGRNERHSTVIGVVTFENTKRPVANVFVGAYLNGPDLIQGSPYTGADGRFTIAGLRGGEMYFRVKISLNTQ